MGKRNKICTEKVCKKCGETLPIDRFKVKHGKPQSICKKCASALERERYRKKHHRETGIFLDKIQEGLSNVLNII